VGVKIDADISGTCVRKGRAVGVVENGLHSSRRVPRSKTVYAGDKMTVQ